MEKQKRKLPINLLGMLLGAGAVFIGVLIRKFVWFLYIETLPIDVRFVYPLEIPFPEWPMILFSGLLIGPFWGFVLVHFLYTLIYEGNFDLPIYIVPSLLFGLWAGLSLEIFFWANLPGLPFRLVVYRSLFSIMLETALAYPAVRILADRILREREYFLLYETDILQE